MSVQIWNNYVRPIWHYDQTRLIIMSNWALCLFALCLFAFMPFCVMPICVMPICVMPISRYTYSHYAYLRYAFSRYAFSCYAFYHSVCLSAFWLAAWYLKRVFALHLRFDAFSIWNIESACCYSALDWCIYNLDNLISIPGYWILS